MVEDPTGMRIGCGEDGQLGIRAGDDRNVGDDPLGGVPVADRQGGRTHHVAPAESSSKSRLAATWSERQSAKSSSARDGPTWASLRWIRAHMCDAQPSTPTGGGVARTSPSRRAAAAMSPRRRASSASTLNAIEAKSGVPSRSDRASAACASLSALSFSPRASMRRVRIAPTAASHSVWCEASIRSSTSESISAACSNSPNAVSMHAKCSPGWLRRISEGPWSAR